MRHQTSPTSALTLAAHMMQNIPSHAFDRAASHHDTRQRIAAQPVPGAMAPFAARLQLPARLAQSDQIVLMRGGGWHVRGRWL